MSTSSILCRSLAMLFLLSATAMGCGQNSATVAAQQKDAPAESQRDAAPKAEKNPAKKAPASPALKDLTRPRSKADEEASPAPKKNAKDSKAESPKRKRNRSKGNQKNKTGGKDEKSEAGSKDSLNRRVQDALEAARRKREQGDTRNLNKPATRRSGRAGANTRKLTTQEKHELDGRFHQAPGLAIIEMTPEQQEQAAALEAIGYLDGSTMATGVQDVVLNLPEKTYGNYNFYMSGHAPAAYLIDMEGKILHSWYCDFATAFPDEVDSMVARGEKYWRKSYLFENGDVLAIYEGQGIVKVDKDSKVIWANPNNAHHDLEVMPNGDIFVLTRKAHMISRLNPKQPILEDSVTVLDADGKTKKSISLIEALEDTEFFKLWPAKRNKRGDVFHTNTLHVLDGSIADKLPEFKKGNVLFSILRFSVVAVLDMETEKVVWAHRGSFRSQHDPKILDNGHLMIFDNKGGAGSSRVLEIDPATKEVIWSYSGTKEKPFYSATCSVAERLPNGNTLVVESDGGRAFELTSDKEMVWEFYNPNRAGENNEYIATLFDVIRLTDAFPIDWASGPIEIPEETAVPDASAGEAPETDAAMEDADGANDEAEAEEADAAAEPVAPEADAPADATADTPAETTADTPADATADTPAETTADTPAETTVDTPAEATADTPAEATADTPAEATADTPADESPEA